MDCTRTPAPHTEVSPSLWGWRTSSVGARCADAIFYVLHTGCRGADLNQTELCAKSITYDRLQEWIEAQVLLTLWHIVLAQIDALQGMDRN